MSTLAFAVVALVLLIGPALVIIVLDASDIWGTESYTISTRDLPNTAAAPQSDTSAEVRS